MRADGGPRVTRRDPGGARATVRDKLALRFIAAAQPVTIDQVARAVQMSVPMARRRLRILRDMGLVVVHLPGGLNGANRVTLSPAARPMLATTFGGDPEDYRVRANIERMNLAHHSAQADVFAALSVAAARSRSWELARFLFEGDLRRALPSARLVPDAVALLHAGELRCAVAFEADLGSESPSFLTKKALTYAGLRAAGETLLGATDWCVAVTVPSARRRNRIALATWEAGVPEGLVHLAVAHELTDRNILESDGWLTPKVVVEGGAERARLVPSGIVPTVLADRSDGGNGRTSLESCLNDGFRSDALASFMAGERP